MIEYVVLYLLVGIFFGVIYKVAMPRFLRLLFCWPGLLIPRVRLYYSGYYDARLRVGQLGSVYKVRKTMTRVAKTNVVNEWYLAGFADALKEFG